MCARLLHFYTRVLHFFSGSDFLAIFSVSQRRIKWEIVNIKWQAITTTTTTTLVEKGVECRGVIEFSTACNIIHNKSEAIIPSNAFPHLPLSLFLSLSLDSVSSVNLGFAIRQVRSGSGLVAVLSQIRNFKYVFFSI